MSPTYYSGNGKDCVLIDFGTAPQTIDDTFYNDVLQYVLVSASLNFMDGDGLIRFVNKLKTAASNQIHNTTLSLPSMADAILPYNSASTTRLISDIPAEYGVLYCCVTSMHDSTQMFYTISTSPLAGNEVMYVDIPDNNATSRIKIEKIASTNTIRMEITLAYNGSAAQLDQSQRGYFKGVWGMKEV
jgi:hypothetical protein